MGLVTESKFMEFEPDAALDTDDVSDWIRVECEYDGRIVGISGSVIDPATNASAAQQLEKMMKVEYKIRRQSQQGGLPVRMSSIVGTQGKTRPVSYVVEKGDVIEVQFTQFSTAGVSLLPNLTMELAAQVPDVTVKS